MKKILVISLILTAMISCEKDETLKINSSENYFPLQIGNQWNFEVAGKDSIIGKTNINGIEYFEFVNDNGISTFYRKENDLVYVKYTKEDEERLMFDLTANIDETWECAPGYVTLVNRNVTLTIGDRQIENCLQFDFRNEDLMDYDSETWLAPGIGFIQQTCQECYDSGYEKLQLKSAKINNQVVEFE